MVLSLQLKIFRVQEIFCKSARVSHVYCNKIWLHLSGLSFGTMKDEVKDESPLINGLESNNYFSTETTSKDTLSKIVDALLSKKVKIL